MGVVPYGYTPHLVPWIKENAGRFRAIIVHGIWQYHSFACWLALRGGPVPYFVFPHGQLDPWFKEQYPIKHLKKWLYWPWADYQVLRDAQGVLFASEEERRLARESFCLYRAREIVTPLGIPAPPGRHSAQKEAFFRRFPFLDNKRIILFFGRIDQKKGCDLVVDAFARVPNTDRSLALAIAGPDRDGLRFRLDEIARSKGVEANIHWLGMLEGDEKWGALRAGEVFILPSHSENFGIAVVEALACGTPVLLSTKVNIWREIVDAGAGYAAEDSIDGTVGLLRNWLSLSRRAREVTQLRALECYRERFEISKVSRWFAQCVLG
jgi:glycosyltransferase involved in cell wall biosynthesis